MPEMKQGFYILRPYIYYGLYPVGQVSGKLLLSAADRSMIKTDMLFSENEYAAGLQENHAITEQEEKELASALEKIMSTLDKGSAPADFSPTEKRLGISLPNEIKTLYSALIHSGSFEFKNERFLKLDELYIDGDNLVFYKTKNTPTAVSMSERTLTRFYKGAFDCSPGDDSFMSFALHRFAVKSILEMPVVKIGKIKGKLKSAISPNKLLTEMFSGRMLPIEEYRGRGSLILYADGALAWFRQNGFYADITVGCDSKETLERIIPPELSAEWND